ncbi:MAG: hypothetical protein ABIO37_19835, partial [Caulobacteraceae bacterium]
GLAAAAAATGASGAAPPQAKFIRVFATPDGGSDLEDVMISPTAKPIPVTSMTAGAYRPPANAVAQWHQVPQPQFTVNLTGSLTCETTNGKKRKIGPGDLVFLHDATGKGHLTTPEPGVSNIFIRVPKDFDVLAWARGE